MSVIAFDSETDPFSPGYQCPRLVCLQWCELAPHAATATGWAPLAPHVETEADGLALLWDWLELAAKGELLLVGAETAYDVLCSVTSAHVLGGPELGHAILSRWVAAYDRDMVSDVLVREKLRDLARGCYRYEKSETGALIGFNEYGLAALARKHAGLELDKETYWRTHYNELRGVPIASWPRDAYDYAALDAYATAAVWLAQWKPSAHVALNFPGKTMADVYADEFRQSRSALWLKAMAAYGLKTDPRAIAQVEKYVLEDYQEAVDTLVAAGLARREYHVKRERVLEYVARRPHLAALCTKTHKNAPPSFTLGAEQRAALAAADPTLGCLVDPRCQASIDAGLTEVTEHRNTKAAKERMVAVCRALGRDTPLSPKGLQHFKAWERAMRHGEASAGWFDRSEWIALDRDACESTEDPLLEAYAEMTHLSKMLSTDLPMLKQGVDVPIHARYEVILETGRTATSKPNVQNQARGKKDRIGARECFVPRPGHVLIDCDYGQLELYCLAQACRWLLGYSSLGDALNAGVDAHTKVAAAIAGITYDQAKALYDAKDPDTVNMRNCAKPVNFGKPGGIGAEKMTAYAAKGYGVKRPQEFWKGVIDTFMATWVEMPAYFQYVNGLKGLNGFYNVEQPYSKRLRAGATYCSACNSLFQGLGSDVAKLAGWKIFKACYVDRSSPLFGARPCLFVHDQFFVEILEPVAAAGAAEVQRLMNEAGQEVLPDVPVKCEPILARRYSKMAKEVRDANGNLTAWEDLRLQGAA